MRLTSQIRVDRTAEDKKDVYKRALDVLRKGNILGIFPEGRRSRDGKLQPAFPGAARIALMAQVPILPVALCGTYSIFPAHRRLPNLKKCRIRIGRVLSLKDYYGQEKDELLLRRITEEIIMSQIKMLLAEDKVVNGDSNYFPSGDLGAIKSPSLKEV